MNDLMAEIERRMLALEKRVDDHLRRLGIDPETVTADDVPDHAVLFSGYDADDPIEPELLAELND